MTWAVLVLHLWSVHVVSYLGAGVLGLAECESDYRSCNLRVYLGFLLSQSITLSFKALGPGHPTY